MVKALYVLLFSSTLHAQQTLKVSPVFEVPVAGPSLLTICQETVWIFAHEKNKILSLSLDGKTMKQYELSSIADLHHLSALACRNNKLLVAFDKKAKPERSLYGLLDLGAGETAHLQNSSVSPTGGRITDLSCEGSKCLLVSEGKVFLSENIKTWKDLNVPRASKLPRLDSKKDINPFDDWQDSLVIAQGRYTKAHFITNGIVLVDPFRSEIAMQKNGEWKKWGAWGVWEGQFLSPKSIAPLQATLLLISDIGLKSLFVFDYDGHYMGVLALGDKIVSPEIGISITTKGEMIFVADYEQNKVFGLQLKVGAKPTPKEGFLRANLFRRPEVQKDAISHRCLKCHDGTVTDAIDKIVITKGNHPVHFEFKGQTDLLLEQGNIMTCASCHNPHHGATLSDANELEATEKDMKSPRNHPPYLRKEWRDLCLSCHLDHTGGNNNHPDKEGKACIKCHQVHNGTEKLLREPVSKLCSSCHKEQKNEHKIVQNFLETDRAKGLQFFEGRIDCMTCHKQHGEGLETKQRIPHERVTPFCASCHGQKAEFLYKDFHSRMKKARGR